MWFRSRERSPFRRPGLGPRASSVSPSRFGWGLFWSSPVSVPAAPFRVPVLLLLLSPFPPIGVTRARLPLSLQRHPSLFSPVRCCLLWVVWLFPLHVGSFNLFLFIPPVPGAQSPCPSPGFLRVSSFGPPRARRVFPCLPPPAPVQSSGPVCPSVSRFRLEPLDHVPISRRCAFSCRCLPPPLPLFCGCLVHVLGLSVD